MAEWLKAHAWNACLLERVTWVRIPLSPPVFRLRSSLAMGEKSGRAHQSIRCQRHSQHHRLRAEVESPIGFITVPDSLELEDAVFERSLFDFQELAVLPFAIDLRRRGLPGSVHDLHALPLLLRACSVSISA